MSAWCMSLISSTTKGSSNRRKALAPCSLHNHTIHVRSTRAERRKKSLIERSGDRGHQDIVAQHRPSQSRECEGESGFSAAAFPDEHERRPSASLERHRATIMEGEPPRSGGALDSSARHGIDDCKKRRLSGGVRHLLPSLSKGSRSWRKSRPSTTNGGYATR